MAVALETFSDWLGNKLRDLNTDEGVFGSYISGILNSDETPEEKNEALQGILSEIVENEDSIAGLCAEIFEQWTKFKKKEPPPADRRPVEDVDIKLAKLLESQCLQTTKQRQYTEEERKIREAILSQYSQMSDDEAEENGACGPEHEGTMHKNTNAQTVAQAEKEKRENARVESQRKKEKDKEDREKQKQMREEKKEKRKTQKGERRR